MLQIQHICKEYRTGNLIQKALDDVSLNLRDNEFVAILGPSGSGKTTLLNIIGGLDRYDSGDLIINGISTKKYKDRDWDSYRNHTIGFVFQSYNLIPHQTLLANVELALTISGVGKAERRRRAKEALENMDLVDTPFSPQLPVGSLHWLIADETGSITVESVKEGLMIYDNPIGVLTNNPPFPQQMFQLNNYMHLSPKQPANTFAKGLSLNAYSRGMGALGLPGDLSSSSRFVRVSYVKMNSRCSGDELSSVSQFFHILGSVDQQRGCCEVADGKYEITLYTSCCNAAKGIYYYTTYDNHQISAVDMHKTDLDGRELARFTPVTTEQIHFMM